MTYSIQGVALIAQGIGGQAGKLYTYTSTDAGSAVDADNYITDGLALGMQVGDSVIVTDSDASPVAKTIHTVTVVDSSGADLSDGVAIGSTNSD